MIIYQDIENVIIRVDDKPTPGSILGYNGNARAGELVIDPTTLPPTVWVGDKNGNLNIVGGGGGGGGGSSISTGTSVVNTTLGGVTIGTGGSNIITVTSVGTTFTGVTNLGSNANITITGGSAGQTLITNGFGALSWGSPVASAVANGTSSVSVPVSGGNVNTSVGGVANVFVVTSTGANVAGTFNATGNVSGGNITTSGSVSAVGNVIGGNIATTGVVSATGNVSGGNITTSGNVFADANIRANGSVITDTITGRTGGVSIVAAGTNQNITLTPSGTGNVTLGTLTNITNVRDPVNPQDAATKYYVDALSQGLQPKQSVSIATTADIGGTYNNGTLGVGATLTFGAPLGAIDGVVPSVGQRVLIKDQTAAETNGIYVVTSSTVLTRAADYDAAGEMNTGTFVFCTSGTVNDSIGFVQTSVDVTTVGSETIAFTQQSAAISYTAGTGLTLATTQFSITDTGVVAGTYGNALSVPQIVVNAQGQITSASNIAIGLGAVANGTSSVSIPLAGGNVNTSVGGVANVFVVTSTGANVAGTFNATGNVTGGNITTAGVVDATGNVSGGNINTVGLANVGSLTVSGTSNLGSNSNVTITGGSVGQVLTTNGSGSLSWTTPANPIQVSRIEWTAISTGFNQGFSDPSLSLYSSADQITLFKNGINLGMSSYSLSGSTLTITEWVNTDDEIAVGARTI